MTEDEVEVEAPEPTHAARPVLEPYVPPEDDAVIGRAVKWSVGAIVVLIVLFFFPGSLEGDQVSRFAGNLLLLEVRFCTGLLRCFRCFRCLTYLHAPKKLLARNFMDI